jgi:hypothetical protein
MELDHGGEGYVGTGGGWSSYLPKFPSWGGEKTEDATGPHNVAFSGLLKLVFERLALSFASDKIESSYIPVVDMKSILAMFKEGTGKAESGHLQIWSCTVGGRAFYVFMRVIGTNTQYSIIRSGTDIMKQKDFTKLEYSAGTASDDTAQRLFIDRIARAVCAGDDLVKILKK